MRVFTDTIGRCLFTIDRPKYKLCQYLY